MKAVRIGIIGIGGRGYSYASMFKGQPGAEIIAAADTNPVRAEKARADLGINFDIYGPDDKLVERSDIDAVVITTPDCYHKQYAVAALAHGKHVLVEKPIATSVADGLEILRMARKTDRLLFMGFNLRYVAALAEARRIVASGRIGAPFYLTATEYYSGGKTYMARWNRLQKFSGGLFLHKGSHDFDILNWFCQPAKPVRVAAFAGIDALKPEGLPFTLEPGEKAGPNCAACQVCNKCPDRAPKPSRTGWTSLFDAATAKMDGYVNDLCIFMSDKDTHDNAVSIIEYDNGAKAFHSEVFVTSRDNRIYTFVGKLGHMEIDLHAKSVVIFPRWARNGEAHAVDSVAGSHDGSDPSLVRSFVTCILRGERPRASGIDGVWSTAVGCAAEISRREKRIVEISELLDPNDPLLKE